ncbi:sigma-70 family RNA polymerase sigma factor [Sorangium sp. So ce124]|uniref:sigma-70 family RNA polymerase sigma factor n=1 Tax=Sorangium sp. So ce124 TaxID=3133280 RepID=UPI003F5D6855
MTATVVALPRERPLSAEQRRLVESDPELGRRAVGAIVKRYGMVMSPDEMLQEAALAVVLAAQSYDPALGPFGRWAFYKACHAILDAAKVGGKHEALRRKARAAMLGRLTEGRARGHGALDEEHLLEVFSMGEDPIHKKVASFCNDLVDEALRATWQGAGEGAVARREQAATAVRVLQEAMAGLSETQRTMLALRFQEDAELDVIAARVGTSSRTMRRRMKELVELLRSRLAAEGVTAMPEWFRGEHGELFEETSREASAERAGGR